LTYSSPCVNAGTPDGAPLFDLDGNPRDALPDMGAYEYVSPVAVEESSPKEFRLLRNYPNPFNASTTITYEIPEPGSVTLSIYNIEGQKVRNLVSGYRDAGTHSVNWNGLNDDGLAVSSGLYFIRIEMGRRVDTEKMVLLR